MTDCTWNDLFIWSLMIKGGVVVVVDWLLFFVEYVLRSNRVEN